MEKYLSVICASRLFSGVDPDRAALLLPRLSPRFTDYGRGDYILHAGEPVSSLGLVLSGRVLVVKEDFWGGRNLLSSLGPGQCFAETFACVPGSVLGVSVVADAPCRILFLSAREMLSSPDHSPLVRNLLTDMAGKNLGFTEKLTHLGQRTTRNKLLSYLSAQAQRSGKTEFDIPFSRQQLADYLLVDRSGLSAELCRMRDEGLLEFHKNHFILHHTI